eukprot:TRINITY_DN35_c1_g1_i1.p1 TRINITY_DN35_c1_g1~~TRINITY_DN35_c1_g1_i1.p1  ORF type:complete len:804 (-),score=211.46 TRINITY_DN35_c1_g1_i1:10789-13200(-)
MKQLVVVWGILSLLLAPHVSFAADQEPIDRQAATEFFEKKIRPLLIQRCDECHSTEKADESGHLALDNRASLIAGGSRGPSFISGKPDESLLIKAVQYADPQLQMPPEGKLAAVEIDLLTKWVRDGAFVPDYGKDGPKKTKEIDWTAAREFWSFQGLHRPPVPLRREQPQSDLRNPIDPFVDDQLATSELKQSAAADKRTLLRRLSFDLLGLPPTPEEVAEFVADDQPDAYERVVDRLLASPHFGERWGRYWLDLARYVDFTPDWQKVTDHAWAYRDWVARAINEDRPYDEFARLQLAADLIPDADPRDFAALGFLGVSPVYWKELKLAPSVIEVIVADEWDERLDTVSRTFLGLTVACARCHDHKFDPISARDYYALAGVFASTQVTDRPLLPWTKGEQIVEARTKIDKLQESLKKVKEKESEEAKTLQQQIDEIRQATPQVDAPLVPVVEDSSVYIVADGPDATKLEFRKGQPRDLPVFRRGNPGNPGDIIPRRFLELFPAPPNSSSQTSSPQELASTSPQPFRHGSGRLELANSLVHEAKGLTARVQINRLWMHHFGKGLVKTPGDFGQQGDRPSHPQLLEWLASEFAEGAPTQPAWSLKRIHRLIVNSATYRQTTSSAGSRSVAVDPDNHLLSRMNRRRLEIEPWRDSMLVIAGALNDRMEGPGTDLDQLANLRRTIYGRIGRDEQNDMLRIYDFPPPTSHSPSRDITTTPLQQLFVFNSDFVDQQSTRLAQRLLAYPAESTAKRIEHCYAILFQRSPNARELEIGEQFLTAMATESEEERWHRYVQSLVGLNEFMFID